MALRAAAEPKTISIAVNNGRSVLAALLCSTPSSVCTSGDDDAAACMQLCSLHRKDASVIRGTPENSQATGVDPTHSLAMSRLTGLGRMQLEQLVRCLSRFSQEDHVEAWCSSPVVELRASLLGELIGCAGEESAAIAAGCYRTDYWLLPGPALHECLHNSAPNCLFLVKEGYATAFQCRKELPWSACALALQASHQCSPSSSHCAGVSYDAAKTPVQMLGIEGCDPHLPCKMSGVTQKETVFESFAVLVYLSAFIWTRTCLPHWQLQLCWNGDLIAGGDVLQLSS